MQSFITKLSTLQTFTGVDTDQRFARDDVEEPILRGRDLRFPFQNDHEDTDTDQPMPSEDDGDEQEEYKKGM